MTTRTVKTSGGDYSSLAAAYAASSPGDEIVVYAGDYTSLGVQTLDGKAPTVEQPITIRAADGEGFHANFDRTESPYPLFSRISIADPYLRISGLVTTNPVSSTTAYGWIISSGCDGFVLDSCGAKEVICDGGSGTALACGFQCGSAGTLRCCAVGVVSASTASSSKSASAYGITASLAAGATINIYQCSCQSVSASSSSTSGLTAYSINAAGASGSTVVIRNCALGTASATGSGTKSVGTIRNVNSTVTASNNAGYTTIPVGSNNQTFTPADTFVDINGATMDLHLKDDTSNLVGNGLDLTGYTNAPTVDIDGDSFANYGWSIGCDTWYLGSTGTGTSPGTGTAVETRTVVLRPVADVEKGSWLNELDGNTLYPSVDEAESSDFNDYIHTPVSGDVVRFTMGGALPHDIATITRVDLLATGEGRADYIHFSTVRLFQSDGTTPLTDLVDLYDGNGQWAIDYNCDVGYEAYDSREDWNNCQVEFTTAGEGEPRYLSEEAKLYWVELQITYIPDGGATWRQELTDSVGAEDSVGRVATYGRALSDTLGSQDSVGNQSAYDRRVSDALGLLDTIEKSMTRIQNLLDTMVISDNLLSGRAIIQNVDDPVGLSDAVVKLSTIIASLVETIGLGDGIERTAAYYQTISESLSLSDLVQRRAAWVETISDSLGMTDDLEWINALIQTISDVVGLSDELERQAAFARAVAETLGMTDQVVKVSAFIRENAETLGLTDVTTDVLAAASFLAAWMIVINKR